MKKWEQPILEDLSIQNTENIYNERAFLGNYKCVKCGKVYGQEEANAIGGTCTNVNVQGEVCKGDLAPVCSCS